MTPHNENEAAAVLINPYSVVVIQDYFFIGHKESAAKEDWVLLNSKLIENIGTDEWLGEFLDSLSQTREEYDGHDAINPSLIVVISPRLRGDHQPIITREMWIQANAKAIRELGVDKWLWRLLDVLETGGSSVA